jgi:Protein of unknown function (DUF2442)
MDDITDDQWDAANERGRVIAETEPHAKAARYERDTGLLVIELKNGATYAVPARHLQGFSEATDDQIAAVETDFSGYGLHWEELDADFTVGGLLAGRFGSAKYMEAFRKRMSIAA